jgi:hypothetical protein
LSESYTREAKRSGTEKVVQHARNTRSAGWKGGRGKDEDEDGDGDEESEDGHEDESALFY